MRTLLVLGMLATASSTFAAKRFLTLESYLDFERVSDPQISPDGTQVVYRREWVDKQKDKWESALWIVSSDGTKNRFLTEGSSPRWSPDGTKLLARRDPSRRVSLLAVWDLSQSGDGTDRRPDWTLPRWDGFSAFDPRWMPDGHRVLFAKRAADAEGILRKDLYLWDWAAGRVSRVTRWADVSEGDPAPERVNVDPGDVAAVDQDAARFRLIEPLDQRDDRALADAGGADQRGGLAGSGSERQAVE